MSGDPFVAIRRKADGKYAGKGGGHLAIWSDKPMFLPSQVKAELKIRIDWGRDLDEFDIVPRSEVSK